MSTPKKLAQIYAPTSGILLYQPDAGTGTLVTSLWVANPTGSSATWTLYDVDNGESAGDNNTIVPTETVAAGKYTQLKTGIVLTSENSLWVASGTANSIAVTVYGMEYSLRGQLPPSVRSEEAASSQYGLSQAGAPSFGGGGFGPGTGGGIGG